MHLYICTTPRHLLFALLRSLRHPQVTSRVLFFSREFESDQERWQTNVLPNHIQFSLVPLKSFKHGLFKSPRGLKLLLDNRFNHVASEAQNNFLLRYLAKYDHNPELVSGRNLGLFVFNDRNPVSRLFIQLVETYNCIEDGEGNYINHQLSRCKRFLRKLNKKPTDRVFSENPRCKSNLVIFPEKVPLRVKSKTFPIDFLDAGKNKGLLLSFFKLTQAITTGKQSIILLTQPFRPQDLSKKLRIELYQKMAEEMYKQGFHVILKPHPRDHLKDYESVPRELTLDHKMPMEIILLGSESKPLLFSICSSTGIGFEEYCTTLKLIENDFFGAIERWSNDQDKWINAFKETLKSKKPAHH
ncbi:glycosyltransferase family 52 [Ferrimonas senticii]|uniref:glycosyltransferase family 52 n=1 Tax=Ferrimonas senticii TaxID=394566 RepID=UPI000420CDB2|nr:glycosyltransferase family 52 [Ferrimonas senticii]